jgi:hypothetical protein
MSSKMVASTTVNFLLVDYNFEQIEPYFQKCKFDSVDHTHAQSSNYPLIDRSPAYLSVQQFIEHKGMCLF